ncbi:MAG: hypothetical protein G01um10145_15 [Microgenomates group bacterium Gr01-1014_5]|nr:MAG: hypothetical protein G01um10145_15 [Microgenomates group bacterium Gr01-1014_5]
MMRLLEAQCGGIKFEEARKKYKDFFDNIPEGHPYSQVRTNLSRTFDMDF